MADLRFVLVPHLGFPLLLQAMLFELLRVHRLVRALRMLLLRTAFALRPVVTVSASAPATAAAVTAPAAMLFAFLVRGPGLSVLLALRSAWRSGRTLVRTALSLRAFHLGKLARLAHLRLLAFALRAFGPGLLLLRALIAALLLVAALMIAHTVASAIAAIALVIAPAIAAPVAAAAPAITSATLAAALLVPVAMLVARAFRPGRTNRSFVGSRRLFDGFFRLEPAEEAPKKT